MDNNSEVVSSMQSDVTSAAVKCYNENTSAEEVKILRLLQKGISETTEEDIALTKEITSILSKLDLDVKTLPNDIKENLDKVSVVLRAERTLEFDEQTLSVSIERRIIEEKRRQREEKEKLLVQEKLLKSCTKLQRKIDNLQKSVDVLENTIDTSKEKDDLHCNKMFLSTKLKEYQQAAEKLEVTLGNMQVDEFYPEQILNKYKLYLENTSHLADLNQLLSQYYDLPPNLVQAKLLLENKKKEYESLENTILQEIN